ncbi:hypothetical protein GCM10022243_46540 [Saccharothrix violaceirubra]|uniref:DUF3224 domain-containing protein n=1 Tax=Saccharothrix violaceirubra TaxID=413306 RepID=A0A7W7WVE8_9PSEU|nr:DUF3224 domain-containing protein [Saccharothrix violaceirubra]MBB4964458.1 hypothetical protein [Saccharothrix violaceirubra]
MSTAHSTATVGSWEERTWDGRNYDEVSGPKRTRGRMTAVYTGDLEGTGENHFLMSYPDDLSCVSVGIEVVTGSLGGVTGTLVLHHDGGYRDGVASGTVKILSGTGGLVGVTGSGTITWRQDSPGTLTLDYTL